MIPIKFRRWFKAAPPRPTRLQIPGWAGQPARREDRPAPQPWHCLPFTEAATAGLELVYPFDTECRVTRENGRVCFSGDWAAEQKEAAGEITFPPFAAFAPDHFGFTSSLDIEVPDGYSLRVETHPRFYTDTTGTAPAAVPGHIQSAWWPRIFFVVFKSPGEGQEVVFRKGEPYAQIMALPKTEYQVREMTPAEVEGRKSLEAKILRYSKHYSQTWIDHAGNPFETKYRQLAAAYAKGGLAKVHDVLGGAAAGWQAAKDSRKIPRLPLKLFK